MTSADAVTAPPRWSIRLSIITVWVLVAVGAVVVLLVAPREEDLVLFPIVLAGATLLSFCLQLLLDSKVGLVNRLMASIGGSVAILTVATVVAVLL